MQQGPQQQPQQQQQQQQQQQSLMEWISSSGNKLWSAPAVQVRWGSAAPQKHLA
jgi:transcription initiation factor TFIID subunit TAF12